MPIAALAAGPGRLRSDPELLRHPRGRPVHGRPAKQWNGGAVASQEAIKEPGTNGGGYFNANSAHPFENPTPFTNLLRSLPHPGDPVLAHPHLRRWSAPVKQGYAILATMATIWLRLRRADDVDRVRPPRPGAPGGRRGDGGREVRFGIGGSSIFAVSTTSTSTGAVDSFHLLHRPGGGITLLGMMLGEIAPGGVGSGLYGMLIMAVIAVFIAGLDGRPYARVPWGRRSARGR